MNLIYTKLTLKSTITYVEAETRQNQPNNEWLKNEKY